MHISIVLQVASVSDLASSAGFSLFLLGLSAIVVAVSSWVVSQVYFAIQAHNTAMAAAAITSAQEIQDKAKADYIKDTRAVFELSGMLSDQEALQRLHNVGIKKAEQATGA